MPGRYAGGVADVKCRYGDSTTRTDVVPRHIAQHAKCTAQFIAWRCSKAHNAWKAARRRNHADKISATWYAGTSPMTFGGVVPWRLINAWPDLRLDAEKSARATAATPGTLSRRLLTSASDDANSSPKLADRDGDKMYSTSAGVYHHSRCTVKVRTTLSRCVMRRRRKINDGLTEHRRDASDDRVSASDQRSAIRWFSRAAFHRFTPAIRQQPRRMMR